MKRHLLQFLKILIYTKGVTWRDTFHNSTIPQIPIYTKGVSSRDTFYNSKKVDLYWKATIDRDYVVESVSWRDIFSINPIFLKLWKVSIDTFHNSQKWNYTEGVSWRDTFYNFLKKWVYTESVFSRDTFHNFHTQ